MRPNPQSAGRAHARAPRPAQIALLWVLLLCGCAQQSWVRVREVPDNPLAGPLQLLSPSGPKPTERTMLLVRRYGLEDDLDECDTELLPKLRDIARDEPSPEKLYAMAEISYLAGKRAEPISRRKALEYHGLAVVNAYRYLFDDRFGLYRNPYDPEFRGACDLYNEALEGALRVFQKQGKLVPGTTQTIRTGDQTVEMTIVIRGQSWRAEDIAKFQFVSDYEVRGLRNDYHNYGLGVPLIAVCQHHENESPEERFYPPGMSVPVTAFLRVMPGGDPARGHHVVHLELYDPLNTSETSVNGRRVPLESDLTTPLAYALNQPELQNLDSSTVGLLNPAKTAKLQGLYMLEPYQPGKIPVLMIHGLWSSPITWMEMFNDLRGTPEIRDRYQFWFYLYPTGQPFWYSAAQLRRDLAEARQVIDPYHRHREIDQMVLVGHSMGGLLARLQTVDSGNEFWRIVSDQPFEGIKASHEAKTRLAGTFFFRPTLSVRRVVTIGTPFRGSEFANPTTRWLSNQIIKIPTMLVNGRQKLYQDNPGYFRPDNLLDVNTSIDSLAPDSPILPVMLGAPAAPWVRYHNVAGRAAELGWWQKITGDGDGVVSYDSARFDQAVSEVVVDAEHSSLHRHPLTILEVQRVLLEHLVEIDTSQHPPSKLERLPWTATTAPTTPPPGYSSSVLPPGRPQRLPPTAVQ
ncbi:MAG: hypothetical protein DWQ37_23105 [Planctomycetota bacterium]|nr:MAG: hypothetical protein DWQ37_23105 [Planctomycetota bacterium]